MSDWRVIITDTESMSGVAQWCSQQRVLGGMHDVLDIVNGDATTRFDETGVYDCCPGPYIECFSEEMARLVVRALNEIEAEVCS